ncbi:MAG: poly(beta-D-mannuronate) O-acetylase [Agrobacterium sp. SCN 61-19]|nr:MAG: poly(beta-D-mannuronate) O-acetylase [Agrobacterium sp. SCN 61-19]
MVFSSETFLFLFLPLFLAAYYLTPDRFKSWTILIGSYLFYCWWRPDFLLLFVGVTAWAYGCGLMIERWEGQAKAKIPLVLGVVGCLSVLGVFKYLNFFVDSFAALLGTTPDELGVHWRLILPIGISFYVFQAVGYVIDVYRKDTPATRNFVDFAAFIALFPQLIAGPILRFKDLADQFHSRSHSLALFSTGLGVFTIGLAKKVLLADSIAPVADAAFASGNVTFVEGWLGAAAYTLQLYFDFSGYSDMAIGLGLMMGFKFIRNFDTPYVSASITEFWQRWHISLSTWLRDYLYIPLGGNRLGPLRTYLNLFLVMLLGGLWHGAAWTFVLWGAWHGGWLAVERYTGYARAGLNKAFTVPATLLLVVIGWVMFRAASVGEAFSVYAGMLGLNGMAPSLEFLASVNQEHLVFIMIAVVAVVMEPRFKHLTDPDRVPLIGTPQVAADGTVIATSSIAYPLAMTALLAVTIARLAEQSASPFLYFQF